MTIFSSSWPVRQSEISTARPVPKPGHWTTVRLGQVHRLSGIAQAIGHDSLRSSPVLSFACSLHAFMRPRYACWVSLR